MAVSVVGSRARASADRPQLIKEAHFTEQVASLQEGEHRLATIYRFVRDRHATRIDDIKAIRLVVFLENHVVPLQMERLCGLNQRGERLRIQRFEDVDGAEEVGFNHV